MRVSTYKVSAPATTRGHCARASEGSKGLQRSGRMWLLKVWLAVLSLMAQPICAQEKTARESHHREDMSQAPEKAKAEQTGSAEFAPAADETRGASPSSELQPDIQVPNDLVSSAADQDLKPDDEIQAAIEGELKASGLALEELSVRVQRGVVFLRGVARSQRAKRSASRLVRRVAGATEVINSIDVKPQFSVKPLTE